ncbi:MAG: hypothetical protein Q8L48_37390 [Archangium sp.]|nr:hypothetical protein [Archangium sp.]
MTRLTLRKGFSLQPAPGGGGQLTDARTGDALVIPAADYEALASMADGLDPGVDVLARYGVFFVALKEGRERKDSEPGFYELDIEDAPTAVDLPPPIPSIPPVAVLPPSREADASRATTLTNVSTAELELKAALAAGARDAETKEHAPIQSGGAPELSWDQAERPGMRLDEAPEVTVPAGERPDTAGQFLSQEENLRLALESHPTEQVSRAEMEAIIAPPTTSGAEPAPPFVPGGAEGPGVGGRPNRRSMLLTVGGVTLLALGVAASFALRPGGESTPPAEVPPPAVVVLDASAPEPSMALDAGAETPADAGVVVPVDPEPLDAGTALAAAEPDAGTGDEEAGWLTANVQARGRVKMAEVIAGAEGELSWTVTEGQRVKSKQALGTVGSQTLTASSVGLAMLKQPTGAVVKRGAVLAEIIYFEAWAKAQVRGAVPTKAWRCEVISAAAQQQADCKVSVVTPKAGGALVMVAIEPRWFDGAGDAVLRLAPP